MPDAAPPTAQPQPAQPRSATAKPAPPADTPLPADTPPSADPAPGGPVGRGPRRLLDVLPHWLLVTLAYGLSVLVIAGVVYVLATVVALLTSLVLAVAGAILLTALLMPLVNALRRVRVPRALGALIAVLVLISAIAGVLVLFGAGFAREADDLTASVGGGVQRIRDFLVDGPLRLSQAQLNSIGNEAADRLRALGSASVSGAATVLEVFGSTALALALVFFLLKDGPAIRRWLLNGVPAHRRERTELATSRGWHTLESYVRGISVIAAVDAVGIGIGLVILGIPLALPLALLTFVLSFIPLLGAFLAGSVAVLVALAAKGPVAALLVLGVVLLIQNAEGNLLEPLIMGRALRLHPAVILVAVAAGALIGGVGGALLATPIVAVGFRMAQTFREPDPGSAAGRPDPDSAAARPVE